MKWLTENPDKSPSDAARQFGITRTTVYRAWDKRQENGACPHCGQTMRQGEKPGGPKKKEPVAPSDTDD
ncbi:MAG: helix-turn-helix domain-containing protein [Telluria sp.]